MKTCEICGKLRAKNGVITIEALDTTINACNLCSMKIWGDYCRDTYTGRINLKAVKAVKKYIIKIMA